MGPYEDSATLEAVERPQSAATPGIRAVPDPLGGGSALRRIWRAVAAGLLGAVLVGAAVVIVAHEAPFGLFDGSRESTSPRQGSEYTPAVASIPRVDGSLSVRTVPAGANISMNSDPQGRTPLLDRAVGPGTHILSIRMDGFAGVDTLVTIRAGDEHDLVLALRPHAASYEAPPYEASSSPTVPSDAGESRPATAEALPQEGSEEDAPVAARYGSITVLSQPAGAAVFADAQRLGTTPLRNVRLEAGSHTLRLSMPDFQSAERTVEVSPDASATVSVDLEAQRGQIRVLVLPWGSIFVDGELQREDTDLRHAFELPAGNHVIRGVHPILGSIERQVRVIPGETMDVVIDLNN